MVGYVSRVVLNRKYTSAIFKIDFLENKNSSGPTFFYILSPVTRYSVYSMRDEKLVKNA